MKKGGVMAWASDTRPDWQESRDRPGHALWPWSVGRMVLNDLSLIIWIVPGTEPSVGSQ